MKNYKEHRILTDYEGETFLVPVEKVERFHELSSKIDGGEPSDEFYKACDDFDNEFSRYNHEGGLCDLPVFLKQKKK